jgi:hypothetical protein
LIDAIRQDRPFNEAKRGAEASLVQIMGRMASHSGQVVTWDQALNHDHEFASGLDTLLTMNPRRPCMSGKTADIRSRSPAF